MVVPNKLFKRSGHAPPLIPASEYFVDSVMSTRTRAKKWISENRPEALSNLMRTSKHYSVRDIWFFTFPIDYFDSSKVGNLSLLLQNKEHLDEFLHLEIPFSFFRDNKEKFDIRSSGDEFDLHISAKKKNWLQCERSKGVSFLQFER